MGQLSLSRSPQSGFQAGNWVEAIEDSAKTMFANINPYRNRLLMNKETAELVEEYQLQFISQNDFDSFLADLHLRMEPKYLHPSTSNLNRTDEQFRNSPYIYKIRYFENLSVKELCSTVYHGRVYIDKVEVRLKELSDVPFYDQLYLYYVCLSGFKTLYEKVGVFEINEEMIFFDRQGQVRLWMNPNLSNFQPNFQPEDYNKEPAYNQGSQYEMLKNLMNIIEENTDRQSVGNQMQFKDYLIDKGLFERLSFSKAIQYFSAYCEENQFSVNTCMISIYELFHQEESLKRSLAQSSSQVNRITYNKHFDLGKRLEIEKTLEKTSDHEKNTKGFQFTSPQPIRKQNQRNSSQYISDTQSYIKNSESNQQALKSASITPKYSIYQTSNTHHYHLSPAKASKNYNELKRSSHQKRQNSALIAIIPAAEPSKVLMFGSPQQSVSYNSNFSHKYTEPTQILQIPCLTNSKNSSRAETFQKQQITRNITFSYKSSQRNQKTISQPLVNQFYSFTAQDTSKPRKQSIIDKLSPGGDKEVTKGVFETSQICKALKTNNNRFNNGKAYNYHTAYGEYTLDKEIADDMIRYLGFNPNI